MALLMRLVATALAAVTTVDLATGAPFGSRTVRLWAGSRFPVATRWKDPFSVNLAFYLNATAQLKDVVDVVSPACFQVVGLNETTTDLVESGTDSDSDFLSLPGLQMQPGCLERVSGLHAQGYRVEPMISSGPNSTIEVMRLRMRDPTFVRACADAMSVLNASGLVFDFELETSSTADGTSYARMLSRVRSELRGRVVDAEVSVATGTGAMSKTDVLANCTADRFISMGTYWSLSSFQHDVLADLRHVGHGRYCCGVCDSCAAQLGGDNNSLGAIDERFRILSAQQVSHLAWWLLEYDSPGNPLPAQFNHEHWWKKIREWKSGAQTFS